MKLVDGMHRKILLSGIALTFFVGFSACERHDWEETKKLHQPHGGHGHDEHHDDAEHHHDGGKTDDHGHGSEKKTDASHPEKDAAHHETAAEPVAAKSLGTE